MFDGLCYDVKLFNKSVDPVPSVGALLKQLNSTSNTINRKKSVTVFS